MHLIVGLGNPEAKYDGTFHNTGFLAAAMLGEKLGMKFKKLDCRAWCAVKSRGGEDIVIAKPTTYMNLSGESVKGLVAKYCAELSELLVIYDDLDLSLGKLRIRQNGSAGTHNGMRNIISLLGRENFPRIRVGIGRPEPGRDIAGYVLSPVPLQWRETYLTACNSAAEAAAEWINGNPMEQVMNKYNTK